MLYKCNNYQCLIFRYFKIPWLFLSASKVSFEKKLNGINKPIIIFPENGKERFLMF